MRRLLLAAALLCACGRPATPSAEAAPRPSTAPIEIDLPVAIDTAIEGMTVSCPTWGWEWGTDAMVDTMKELKELGVEWITIHPYARISNDGGVGFKSFADDAPPEFIARPIREAHALGLKIMIKPHLAYWSSKFGWRGEIAFEDPTEEARFFREYTAWIEAMAVASRGADLFVVGTELDGLTHRDAQWRRVIAAVRAKYTGPLTFASNWDSYRRIGWWDALDAVGIQAYFPLVDSPSAPTTSADLDRGWARVIAEVTAHAAVVDRPVVFTELGYNLSSRAAVEPWAYERGGRDAEGVQTRAMAAALEAIAAEPVVRGAFVWKWFPGPTVGEDFLASTPAMREVLGAAWGDGQKPPRTE